jgi:5-methylcytosine-specific restriction endonuclease McrA
VIKRKNKKFDYSKMKEFFLQCWKEKSHYCEECNKFLGNEPKTYMFDHLLEKSKYPELAFEKNNIMITCLECHDKKTRGFLTNLVSEKIKNLKNYYKTT